MGEIEKIFQQVNNLLNEREIFNEKILQQIDELCKNLNIKNSLFIEEKKDGINKYYVFKFYNKYIKIFENDDERIMNAMNIEPENFKNKIKSLNGMVEEYFIQFNNKEDAEKALEWINSMFVINKLIGE